MGSIRRCKIYDGEGDLGWEKWWHSKWGSMVWAEAERYEYTAHVQRAMKRTILLEERIHWRKYCFKKLENWLWRDLNDRWNDREVKGIQEISYKTLPLFLKFDPIYHLNVGLHKPPIFHLRNTLSVLHLRGNDVEDNWSLVFYFIETITSKFSMHVFLRLYIHSFAQLSWGAESVA